MKQPLGRGHAHQRADLSGAAGLAPDGHIVGISAEIGDVVANPFERGDNVQHSHVAGLRVTRVTRSGQIEVAEDVEAVIGADHDDIVAGGEIRAVVEVGCSPSFSHSRRHAARASRAACDCPSGPASRR